MKAAASNILKLLLLFSISSCVQVKDYFSLVSQEDSENGVYSFSVNLEHTGVKYDTFVVARVKSSLVSDTLFPVNIYVTDPDGITFIERVDFPLFKATEDVSVSSSGRSDVADFRWPYRSEVTVTEEMKGEWIIKVEPTSVGQANKVISIGFNFLER